VSERELAREVEQSAVAVAAAAPALSGQEIFVLQQKLQSLRSYLNAVIYNQEEMVDGVIMALVTAEHAALVGAPGTAKTFLVDTLASTIGARVYKVQLHEDTRYEEVFGPLDVHEFLSKSVVRRRWSTIVEADILFLDEMFNASSVLLNAFLSIMQERRVYDAMTGEAVATRTHSVIATSNWTPDDERLAALYDRFLIRVFPSYLKLESLSEAVKRKWLAAQPQKPAQPPTITDFKRLSQLTPLLFAGSVNGVPLYEFYCRNVLSNVVSLRDQAGFKISDRTLIEKLPKLFIAYLFLRGFTEEAMYRAVSELPLLLARSAEEKERMRQAMMEKEREVRELALLLEEVEAHLAQQDTKGAFEKLNQILTFDVSKLSDKPKHVVQMVEAIIERARRRKEEVEASLRSLTQRR
jgi:MoxR-like ATPase